MHITPVDLLTPDFFEKVDMVMRQGMREIVSLPIDTPLPVYYTGHRFSRLDIIRVKWEASLQYFNIYQILRHDVHLKMARKLEKEMIEYRKRLDESIDNNVRAIRSELRKADHNKWKALPR